MARTENLRDVMAKIATLQDELEEALDSDEGSRAERVLAEIASLERRRNRLVHQQMREDAPAYSTSLPLRERVISSLRFIGRPASVALVSDVARARFGEVIDRSRIASLRRDEENSWNATPGGRAVYVVPGLSSDRFTPVRGTIALSTWPIEERIVAPASPRVDVLHAVVRFAEELAAADSDDPWAEPVERVLWRLARTVPGAVEGDAVDPAAISDAARKELEVLEPDDRAERSAAADRARQQLSERDQLFGASLEVVPSSEEAAG